MTVIDAALETVLLTVPARADYLRIVRLVMAGVGNALSFNVEEIDDLKTAVGEAYNLFHPSDEQPLTMCTAIEPRRVVIDFTQQATHGPSTFFPMDPALEKGIGLLLMKHLMDEVEYETDDDRTHIRIIKRRR